MTKVILSRLASTFCEQDLLASDVGSMCVNVSFYVMHQCPSSIVMHVHTRQVHGVTEEDEGRGKKRRVQNLTWRRFLSFVCVCVLARVAAFVRLRGNLDNQS